MKIIYGLVTCNRPEYFESNLSTLIETMDLQHDWHIIIGDDSSIPDYTLPFVERLISIGVEVSVVKAYRRGPRYLVNKILRMASEIDFDYGFMAEDDVFFVKKGWDNLYVNATKESSFEYLCYFNSAWAKNHGRAGCVRSCVRIPHRLIQSEVGIFSCFGCFWTFTPKLIEEIGYFDMYNFGVWGNGHTDYAKRCCRSNFNGTRGYIYDALDSQNYIQMQDKDYVSSYNRTGGVDSAMVGIPNGGHKSKCMEDKKRKYIPYNELKLDMLGREVL